MIEINILIRFLAKDPDLHVDLWQAEGERTALAMAEEHNRLHSGRWGKLEIDESTIGERRATIAAARRRAVAAGVPGAERGSALVPSTVQQLEVIDENAASEVYTLGYRPMSWEVHSGAQALQNGTFEERNDASVSYSEAATAEDMAGPRALCLTTFASTLELVAMHLGLAIESQAREIRCSFVPDEIPPEQRFEALQADMEDGG
jgi:hypothetical protein